MFLYTTSLPGWSSNQPNREEGGSSKKGESEKQGLESEDDCLSMPRNQVAVIESFLSKDVLPARIDTRWQVSEELLIDLTTDEFLYLIRTLESSHSRLPVVPFSCQAQAIDRSGQTQDC